MSALAISMPYQQVLDLSGSPLDGGKVYFGKVGTNPLIPANQIPIFWDFPGTQPAPQPVRTINGYFHRSGSPATVFSDQAYSMAVYDKGNRLVAYSADAQAGSAFALSLGLGSSEGAKYIGFTQKGVGAVFRTLQDKTSESITPYDFGAIGDGVADDTTAMERWLARSVEFPDGHYRASGQFLVSRPLSANYGGKVVSLDFNCIITSNIQELQDVLTINDSYCLGFNGFLCIIGFGGTSYANRKNLDGLVVRNCSRFSYEVVRVLNFLRDGMRLTGTTSQPDGKYLQVGYCGSSAQATAPAIGWHTTASIAGARSGSSGSTSQSQQIALSSPLPSYVDSTGWYLQIRGEVYKIINAADLSNPLVYPWLNDNVSAGDTVDLMGGAGYYTIGGDVSAGRIGHLDSTGCGFGFQSLSLYPTSIGSFIAQGNGAIAVFGGTVSGAITSCAIDYLYRELNTHGVLIASTAAFQLSIGPTVAFGDDGIKRLSPRLTNNTISPTFQNIGPGVSWISDRGLVRGTNMGVGGQDPTTQTVFLEGVPGSSYTVGQSTTSITLPNPIVNAITGLRSIEVVAFGTGANQAHTSPLAFTPPAGHSINGGAADAPLSFTGMTKPAIFKIMFAGGTAWRIAKFDAA